MYFFILYVVSRIGLSTNLLELNIFKGVYLFIYWHGKNIYIGK